MSVQAHGRYGPITVINGSIGTVTPTNGSFVQIGVLSPDCSGVAISVNGTYTGALSISVSVDGNVWTTLTNAQLTNLLTGVVSTNIASAATGVWTLPVNGYMSVRVDAQAAFTGTANVGINEATLATTTVPASYTWSQSTACPQSGSDTVVKASAGFLQKVLVTTLGTAALPIYDNASAGSGTIIGVIPASAPAGTIYTFNTPAALGITIKGAASEPAVTVFWS